MGHLRNMLWMRTGSGARAKLRLAWGKVRRFYQGRLRKDYVESQAKLRKGQCLRCGQCCKLLYACPELETLPDGSTQCRIHEKRPINCRIFPVDPRDLEDRNLVGENGSGKVCGFIFVESD